MPATETTKDSSPQRKHSLVGVTACKQIVFTIWSVHGHHQMVNAKIRLIIFFAAKDGEALYSEKKTRLEADCDSDHEFLIAKFRLKLKKVGKTTRPFRYDLN